MSSSDRDIDSYSMTETPSKSLHGNNPDDINLWLDINSPKGGEQQQQQEQEDKQKQKVGEDSESEGEREEEQ